jgi:hypothetical protein
VSLIIFGWEWKWGVYNLTLGKIGYGGDDESFGKGGVSCVFGEEGYLFQPLVQLLKVATLEFKNTPTFIYALNMRTVYPVIYSKYSFIYFFQIDLIYCFIVFHATFSNTSSISWRPVLVVEEAGVLGENHRP